ncbi:hypothetical protein EIN_268310 [Entamoeba invadens IP1]|uniref:Uncharacterized protein n=1 Tax=Entamoeba invadens IP1 TaxID=370355 RepID=A0A0A1UE54_ENTIV|nr:hypothetical protein EIN_268310 [Entamoeba invadens IP1]ELP91085.1 hypothetical protein EIN_268310 [Entamoeba invadens IP1]|eukprot:XP_004257856.1 hypothetical protein EIN_268310 [Entamoeba invadens IP1]
MDVNKVYQLTDTYFLFLGETSAMVADPFKNVITCELDLSTNIVLRYENTITCNGAHICALSKDGLELYDLEDGVMKYLGFLDNPIAIGGVKRTFTDATFCTDMITFSDTTGNVVFLEYPSMKLICNVHLIDAPILFSKFDESKMMLYIIDSNNTFYAMELNNTSYLLKRKYVEEKLDTFVVAPITPTGLKITPTGCFVFVSGKVLIYIKDIPSLRLLDTKDDQEVKEAMCNGSTVLLATLKYVYYFDLNSDTCLDTFRIFPFGNPRVVMLANNPYPMAMSYIDKAIRQAKIPDINSKRRLSTIKQTQMKFKSVKMSKDTTIMKLALSATRDVYGIDSLGHVYHASLLKTKTPKPEPFGDVGNIVSGNLSCFLTANNLYGVFTSGTDVRVAHLKTHTHVITPFFADVDNKNYVTSICGCEENCSLIGVGTQNGEVYEVDCSRGRQVLVQKQESPILYTKYLGPILASISVKGVFEAGTEHKEIAEDPISFDYHNGVLLVVETKRITTYKIDNWDIESNWESDSCVITAKFSCDGEYVVVLTKDRIMYLKTKDLSVFNYLSNYSVQSMMKGYNTDVFQMDVSPNTPCQIVISFVGGNVMLIEPSDYTNWN